MSTVPVPKSILVPREAYRYWPVGEDVVRGSNKKIVRFIFENQILTDFEKTKLDRLLQEIKNNKIEGQEVPKSWSNNHILRFCYGTGWKTRASSKSLVAHLQWRKEILPQGFKVLYPKVLKLLVRYMKNSGVFYIHGRDYKYRPLIVMNLAKVDFKKNSIDEYTQMLCFLLEYVVEYMLLPGQIENWVVLTDLGKNGLGNMSVSSLKQVLKMLQCNYKCRLAINYIVNPPKSIWVLWSCIKPFLDDVTIDKIKIANSSYSPEMLSMFNPLQVEEKYGGKGKNLEDYWPPTVPHEQSTPIQFASKDKRVLLSDKDSYFTYHPEQPQEELEVVEEEEEIVVKPKKKKKKKKNKPAKVNSLEVSAELFEACVEDLANESFARSDIENAEENLIDFEVVSPFTRKFERNPTFKEWGQISSKNFQKKITMRAYHDLKGSEGSLESSVDFEKDSRGTILAPHQPEPEKPVIEIGDSQGLIIESNSGFCQCKRIECGIIKNSCVIA